MFREAFHEGNCAQKVEESIQFCKFLLFYENDF